MGAGARTAHELLLAKCTPFGVNLKVGCLRRRVQGGD